MLFIFLTVIAVLAALALGIMFIVGIFSKRVNGHANFIVKIIKTLKISWKNSRRLPSQIWLLIKILPRKRRLLFIKITNRLKTKKKERKIIRNYRRTVRKRKRQARRQKRRQKKITKNRSF